jgi:hypothetical protein
METQIKFSTKCLSRDIFVSLLINELHDGVCNHEYLYCITTSYSSLITFCEKIVHWSRFDQGAFLSQCLEPFGGVCRYKYPHCVATLD